MIRSLTLAAFILVGLAAYAVGQQTRIPEIILAQNKVKGLMDETQHALDPILKKKGGDASENDAKQQALKALAILKTAIGELKETTDKQVDRIVAAAKK
jgi:hypothetical protein